MPNFSAIREAQMSKPSRQLPSGLDLYLDHAAHFVADRDTASAALARAGFAPSPISIQVNPNPIGPNPIGPNPSGGASLPTGTGNVCAMLENGYVEVLFKTADTALGRDLDSARARYEGLHLAAFAVADAARWHAHLVSAGFRVLAIVDMTRPVETIGGFDTAAFSVVRLEAGQMPEGRIQMLRHHTEHAVWQPRWLDHPNTAVGLVALTIAVQDLAEATARFTRFFGRDAEATATGSRFALDRGRIDLMTPEAFAMRWPGLTIPSLPFIGICTLAVRSIDTCADVLTRGGLHVFRHATRIEARFPPELGHGLWEFIEQPARLS